MPDEVLEDVGRALRLVADLADAGLEVSLDPHPVTGRTTASLHDGDGTLRVLPLGLLGDVDALRRAVLGAVDDGPG